MSGAHLTDRLAETAAVFDGAARGEPLTTSEIAAELSVSRRSTYERLSSLADAGVIETKKVGAKGRVWWRSARTDRAESSTNTVLERRVRRQRVVTELGKRALETRDIAELVDVACERVAETLDNDYCKVLDLDDDGERLTLRAGVGWDEGVVGEATVSATEEGSQAAYTLATDEPVVVRDLASEPRFTGPELLTNHGVTSGVSVIIGTTADPWGIFGTHDCSRKSVTSDDVNFVQSVANILASAITRHRDEQRLVHQRRQLVALNNLQEGVRIITEAVIDQSTREEIETVVVEHLAASESYEFAWIGDVDHRSQTVRVRTEAGVEDYLGDISISVDPDDEHSGGPTGQAFRTAETQTSQHVGTDERYEPWRDHAESHGYQSSAAIPIVHEDTVYGVLNVYSDRANGITGREETVITQLGEIVGHAIAAVERKRALMSDTVVELGFHIGDIGSMLGIDSVTGTVTIDGAIPITDGAYLVYGSVSADSTAFLETVVDRLAYWDEVTVHEPADGEQGTFEAHLTEPPVLTALAAAGGALVEAGIDDGSYHMRLELPPGADVRSVIETVQDVYPTAEMLTRRQTTRGESQSQTGALEIGDRLTDRQSAVLRTAYHAGFFDWPRRVSGEEVAGSLDIAAPTFHQHLRKAEKAVFDSLVPRLV